MKKKSLLASALLTVLSVGYAQTNANFESWTPVGTAEDPTGWFTYNQYVAYGVPVTVEKITTGAAEGSFSAKVKTVDCPVCPSISSQLSDTIPGGLQLTLPYTLRPTSFDFMWKGIPAGPDAGVAVVQLTRWTGTMQEVVGQGVFKTSNGTSWVTQNVIIQYANSNLPDTMMISFAASGASIFGTGAPLSFSKPVKTSELSVDNIVFSGVTGVQTIEDAIAGMLVYPNPSSAVVNFRVENNDAASIVVYDVTGKIVNSITINNLINQLDVTSFNSGIYFYQLKSQDGTVLHSGKFNVSR